MLVWRCNAGVVCCTCSRSYGGWGRKKRDYKDKDSNDNLPGADCEAPFKCKLVKYGGREQARWKPRSTYGDRSWLDDQQWGGEMGGESSSGSDVDVASDYDTALSSDDSDVFDLSPSFLPLNQLLVSDLYLKGILATSLFAALINAESLCTVKDSWLYWRNLTVNDNVDTKRVLHMAFKKFAKGLSGASSKHTQFRLFRSKLAKILCNPKC